MLCQPFGHKGQRSSPRRLATHGHAQVSRFPICCVPGPGGQSLGAAASRAAPVPGSGAQSGRSYSPGG